MACLRVRFWGLYCFYVYKWSTSCCKKCRGAVCWWYKYTDYGKNPQLLNYKVQTVRKQLENWFNENRLIINAEKSKVILFRQNRTISSFRPFFCINNKEVVRSVDVKFLGIFITEGLSWEKHTHYVSQKLRLFIW
jgi:hypothetical protein